MKYEPTESDENFAAGPGERFEDERSRETARLQWMLDAVPALIAYVDDQGRYQWVNEEYRNWYGLGSDELVGRVALEVLAERIGPEYAEQLRPRVEAALEGRAATFEATHDFGGRRHDFVLSYRPDFAPDGRVRGFVLLVTDLTEQRQMGRELKEREQRLRTLTEMLPSIVWSAGPDGRIEYVSRRFSDFTGLSPESGTGEGWTAAIQPEDLPATVALWRSSMARGAPFDMQYRIRRYDGEYRWCLARAAPERDERGEIVRWLGVSTDIHAQVAAEEAARESERRYRLLFEDNPVPMVTYDTETLQILSVNDLALRKYGYTREEFLGLKGTDIRLREDIERWLPCMHEPPEGSPIGPVRHRRKDGSWFWAEVTCHSLSQGHRGVRIVVVRDVTQRVRLDAELARRANYDSLTGLPNRRLLVEHFDRAVERAKKTGQRVALLAIDFDRFKQVNDTFGHQAGDEFLKTAALRLLSALPESDTLARTGGDEFTVLADCLCSNEECRRIADRLIAALHEPIQVLDMQLQTSISVGVALYPDHGADFDELHQRADLGLYDAKRLGGACWSIYSPGKMREARETLEMESGLREAVREGAFELHYQPIVSPGGEVRALEALLRFPHPKLGLLSPDRFIPVAEESGMIVPMGLWVLREACEQLSRWRVAGLTVAPIAVNVSAAQFRRGNLAGDIRKILAECGVEPELLEIELTETLLMENTEHSWQQLRLLKGAGVRIAVDDFGTGYSSLSYLHRLPLDRLKIDRSFVRAMTTAGSKPIVRAVLELGRALGLSVIAEGVETPEQFGDLVEMGCDLLQGFLFSVPRPAAEIERFLTRSVPATGAVLHSQVNTEHELLL